MATEWFGWLGNVLPILLLLPLIWIVGGFFADSIRRPDPLPSKPTTRTGLVVSALSDVFLVGLWAYFLWEEIRDRDGSRLLMGGFVIGIVVLTYQIVHTLIEAYRLEPEGTASPGA
jgi:uncharacterized membrane protein YjdF